MTIIEIENLTKSYGGRTAVDGVTLSVDEGEIFGIVGPNGAGKTTTVECLSGLRVPDSGSIAVAGLHPQRDHVGLSQVLGVQLQQSQLPDKLKVSEALDLYSSFYRDPADWQELTAILGLEEKRSTPFRKLSGGQKQRLNIALALIGNPRVVILDELTTGLDPQARRNTWDLVERIRDRGVTVLMVTHFMEEAERLCDRLAIIDRGKVVAVDSPTGLVARVSDRQLIRCRPSAPVDLETLLAAEEVVTAEQSGSQLVVTGTGNLLHVLTSSLARSGVVPADLRIQRASLEDAFIALTGRSLED
ncbi:ABC transporter ATP-binding protein [Nesterenkonia rhizosphaerae]|uniref:ABC transporter ATP-binding protein n=1 Tax=Nesterenkonia rhizosphaerae TaxID=1348272 RepID=A0ABP9FSB0_9MICC